LIQFLQECDRIFFKKLLNKISKS